MSEQIKHQAYIERYKYVLEQKRSLNQNTFTILTIFQGGAAVLVAAQYSVCVELLKTPATKHVAFVASCVVITLFVLLGVFSIIFIVGGISNWFRYKNEQSNIETEIFEIPSQSSKNLNLLTWYETYVIAVIVIILAMCVYVEIEYIFPMLN
jgi:energy-coupling factor transporter transmembrane protein EcfT